MKSERIGWIESLRAIALFMVIVTHFIAAFCPEAFSVWQTNSLFLKGISGKHGVAIFCVLIGYFASAKKNIDFATYTIKRYLQFSINILLVLLPFTIVKEVIAGAQFAEIGNGIVNAFKESVFFRDEINPTLWCVRDLFFGSLCCFILGNYCDMTDKRMKLVFVFATCAFVYFVDVWIAVCILGVALRVFQEIVLSDKVKLMLCVLFIIAIPLLYRHEESTKTYLMQGFSCCLFMYVFMYVKQSCIGKYLPGFRILPFIGSISFYVFIWHTPINYLLISLDLEWKIWTLFIISFSATLVLSFIQHLMNAKWINPQLNRIQMNSE